MSPRRPAPRADAAACAEAPTSVDALSAVFEDLEQQADALARAERQSEVEARTTAEYASVDLAARLHASIDHRVELVVQGVGPVRGQLDRAGEGWCALVPAAPEGSSSDHQRADQLVVPFTAVLAAHGLSRRARAKEARGLTARLGLGSVLRELADARGAVALTRTDGHRSRGQILRVGADFLELATEQDQEPVLVTHAAVAVVRAPLT